MIAGELGRPVVNGIECEQVSLFLVGGVLRTADGLVHAAYNRGWDGPPPGADDWVEFAAAGLYLLQVAGVPVVECRYRLSNRIEIDAHELSQVVLDDAAIVDGLEAAA